MSSTRHKEDPENDDREHRLNEAAARYFQHQAEGKHVDRQEWLKQFPDLADELASFISNIDFFKQEKTSQNDETQKALGAGLSSTPNLGKPASPLGSSDKNYSIPTSIGPYVELATHARGGLGEVFRGTDPGLHRTVAVKRLQDRLAGDLESRRRFLFEAEVTARLEHPGVVPVFGLFLEEGGRPAYAMRFVQGPTLWDAIQEYHCLPPNPLTFRRLLQAFVHVCQTVAYAHSRGIIHRDLKPQNIMIGKFGEALVLDWGLAKLVGRPEEVKAAPASEETLLPGSGSGDETAMGSAVGTPAYMSPEQAAGRWDIIAHAADIYGLGAVLYAVLTGKAPLEGGNWPEIQQRIQRGDFPRPRQVSPQLSRPLEAVCLQAMAIQPADRYKSAAALAIDLEHWLADEPVAAFREPFLARSRRWLRHHRKTVITAVLLLTIALAGSCAWLVLLRQKNQEILMERNAAQTAAAESDAVNAFLADDLLGQADPDLNSRDEKVTVEDVLTIAATKIDGNPKFADKPAVEATLRLVIGKTYEKLSNLPEAENHLRKALELRRKALGPDDPDTLTAQEALADFLSRGMERFEESEPLARQTWEARKRVLGADDRATLDSLDTYAGTVWGLGRGAEALALYRQCMSDRLRVLGMDDSDTLTSMNNLGSLLVFQGEWGEAVELLRQVVKGREKQGLNSHAMAPAGNLANALYNLGELDEADALLNRYVPLAAKLLSPEHRYTQNLKAFQDRVWVETGRAGEGLPDLQSVVASRRQTYPDGSWRIAAALVDLGRAHLAVGQVAEAEAVLAEAQQIYRDNPAPTDYYSAWAESCHGQSLVKLERFVEAEPLLLDAEKRLRSLKACPRRHYRQTLEELVALYDARQMPDEATRWKTRLAEEASTK